MLKGLEVIGTMQTLWFIRALDWKMGSIKRQDASHRKKTIACDLFFILDALTLNVVLFFPAKTEFQYFLRGQT